MQFKTVNHFKEGELFYYIDDKKVNYDKFEFFVNYCKMKNMNYNSSHMEIKNNIIYNYFSYN